MRVLFAVVGLIIVSGCGKGEFSGSYSGTETGTVGTTPFTQDISVTFSQSDSTVSGTWSAGTSGSNTGTISGTADGDKLDPFTVIASGATCPGSFSGSATRDGDKISATVKGTSSCGEVSAIISVTKK